MIPRTHMYICLAIWTGVTVISLLAWPWLPDPAPIHWNIHGQVDGWGPPWQLAFLMPGLSIGLLLLLTGLPLLGPFRRNFESFRVTYGRLCVVLIFCFAALHSVLLMAGLGKLGDIGPAMALVFGLMFAGLGNWLGKVRRNLYIGIRTPWTIVNDEVWERTHRLGARLFVGLGVVLVVLALLAPGWLCFIVMISGAVSISLTSVIYSLIVYRQVGASEESSWS